MRSNQPFSHYAELGTKKRQYNPNKQTSGNVETTGWMPGYVFFLVFALQPELCTAYGNQPGGFLFLFRVAEVAERWPYLKTAQVSVRLAQSAPAQRIRRPPFRVAVQCSVFSSAAE